MGNKFPDIEELQGKYGLIIPTNIAAKIYTSYIHDSEKYEVEIQWFELNNKNDDLNSSKKMLMRISSISYFDEDKQTDISTVEKSTEKIVDNDDIIEDKKVETTVSSKAKSLWSNIVKNSKAKEKDEGKDKKEETNEVEERITKFLNSIKDEYDELRSMNKKFF